MKNFNFKTLLLAIGLVVASAQPTWAATKRYIYCGISKTYQDKKDGNNWGFNFWGGTDGGVKGPTWIQDKYNWDNRDYWIYRVEVYDDNNKAQIKVNSDWWDPGDGVSVTLNGTTNNAIFFSNNDDGWAGQFQQNYQETSTGSLSAGSSTTTVGTQVTLTPALTSNSDVNEIKSTAYSVTTNPGSAGSVSNGKFSATAAGTYVIKATITYNPKGFTGITKTVDATTTITVEEYQVIGPAFSSWGEWTKMTKFSSTDYTITITNVGEEFKVSWKNGYDSDWYKDLSWDETNKVGVTQSGTFSSDANAKVELESGYADPVVLHLNPSTKKIWAVATKVYTVTYAAPDKTSGSVPTDANQYKQGDNVTVLGNTGSLAKTGYSFASWKHSINSNTYTAGQTFAMGTADVTMTAQWTAKTTTITLDAKGGTDGTAQVTATYDAAMPAITKPTKNGYNFDGYYDADGSTSGSWGTQYYSTVGASARTWDKDVATATLYAKWTEIKHTASIAYVCESISIKESAPSGQAGIATTTAITAPEITGYTFSSWATLPSGASTSDELTSATINVNLTADHLTITANYNRNATFDLVVNAGTHVTTVTGGVTGEASVPFTKQISATAFDNGYEFNEWTASPSANAEFASSTSATTSVTVKNGSVEVTANAKPSTYTITYNGLVGGTHSNPSTYTIETATITLQDASRDNYTFDGWFTNSECTGEAVTTIPQGTTGNKEYWAKWHETLHAVTINKGTGISSVDPIGEQQVGNVIPVAISAEVATGYTWSQWTSSTANVTITEASSINTSIKATGTGTVTATATENMSTITVNANQTTWGTISGAVSEWSATTTAGVATTRTLTATPNYGYKFTKWILFGGAQFQDGSTETDAQITIKGDGSSANGTATATFEEDLSTPWKLHIWVDQSQEWQEYQFTKNSGESTGKVAYYSLQLNSGEHDMELMNGSTYYKNNGTFTYDNCTNWTFTTDASRGKINCSLAGTYTFKVDYSDTNPSVSVTYPSTAKYNVTISADDNGSVAPDGSQEVDGYGISVTATPDPGYRFKEWVTSDGVTVTNSTSATTTVKASQAGTLQATFTTEGMIYFNKAGISSKWTGDVYVYFYSGPYWDDKFNPRRGSGSKTTDGGACTSGPRKMTRLGNSQIYYFDYAGAGITKQSNVICFTDKSLSNADNFYQCSASYRTDFHTCANMFVPRDYIDYYNECAYYSKGYWRTFQSTDPGYDIHIYNSKESGGEKTYGDFTSTSNLSNDFTFTTTLDGNHTYGFKISSCGGTWYGNQGTMTQDCNWEFDSEGNYDKNCGLTTTATGEYKFTLNCTDGWLRVSVEYPLSVGDYRLAYEELSGSDINKIHPTHHIKALRADGTKTDTVSFFVEQKANAHIYLQKCTAISGTNITWTNENGKKVDLNDFTGEAGVYNFTLTQTKNSTTLTPEVALLEAYKGPYYIRTDCAGGGWSSYDIADNEMTQSDILAQNTNGFDHYFVKWISTNTNVKYCVANDYSEALTDSLEGDTYIGEDKQTLPKEANVRFMWNSKTNALERAYLSGSTNTEDRYLVLIGDARMFLADGSEILEGTEENHRKGLNANELNFTDKNNWVYQADIKAQPSCAVKLTAKYNNQVQYFIGAEGDAEDSRKTIIAGSGTDMYTMRVVYDFKTNLLLAGWVPSDTIKSDIVLGGDMLITRTHQDSAQQVTFGTSGSISDIHNVYAVLTIKKDVMVGKAETQYTEAATNIDYDRTMYWISFPFDVKISEVFGVDGYGKKWIMQRYNGEKRAEIGWFQETETFWEYLAPTSTLQAYKGYLLILNANYFNTDDADVWKNSATEANFYFPSAEKNVGIINKSSDTIVVPAHECLIDRKFGENDEKNHKITDSHWNVIGIPTFQNSTASSVNPTDNNFRSYYAWNPATNGYQAQTTLDAAVRFNTMQAYMVQYAGKIIWENVSVVKKNVATAPKYAYADEKNYLIDLTFSNGEAEDKTYIHLDDEASTDFVLNEDMMKITNAGTPNIYTYAGAYDVAFNETKMDNQTVTLGVSAPKAGTYTFAMPNQFSGTAKLMDLVEGITTDLNVSNYSVDLSKGTYNDRFQLLLEVEAKAPTSIENVDGGKWSVDGKTTKILRNGNIYLINAGRVYNVLGVEE